MPRPGNLPRTARVTPRPWPTRPHNRMEPTPMPERTPPPETRLRWSRIATLAATLLLHLGFLVVLLAAPSAWRWPKAATTPAPSDALLVQWLPASPRTLPAHPPRTALHPPAATPKHRPARAAQPVRKSTATPVATTPQAIDSLIVSPPPSFIANGGRFAAPRYGRQNLRLPGSDQTVRGAPVLPMIDPHMQGLAGVVHFIGSLTGAVDPHCLDLEAWRSMTPAERSARHVDTDAAQMDAIATRHGCKPPPPRPGDPTYYRGG